MLRQSSHTNNELRFGTVRKVSCGFCLLHRALQVNEIRKHRRTANEIPHSSTLLSTSVERHGGIPAHACVLGGSFECRVGNMNVTTCNWFLSSLHMHYERVAGRSELLLHVLKTSQILTAAAKALFIPPFGKISGSVYSNLLSHSSLLLKNRVKLCSRFAKVRNAASGLLAL